MEKSTRMWLAIGAAICGVLAVIGWSVAIYAFRKTPQIHDVIVLNANGDQSSQSKSGFLFVAPAFQTFLFWMLLHPNITWQRYVRKVTEKMAPYDIWVTKRSGVTFPTFCKLTSIGLCILSGVSLYWAVERAGYLVSKL